MDQEALRKWNDVVKKLGKIQELGRKRDDLMAALIKSISWRIEEALQKEKEQSHGDEKSSNR